MDTPHTLVTLILIGWPIQAAWGWKHARPGIDFFDVLNPFILGGLLYWGGFWA